MYENVKWQKYRVSPGMPVAVFVHVCSTRVPFKELGKECVADRPEVAREIERGVRYVARKLRDYLSRKEREREAEERARIYGRYLKKLAHFATELAGKRQPPSLKRLLERVRRG